MPDTFDARLELLVDHVELHLGEVPVVPVGDPYEVVLPAVEGETHLADLPLALIESMKSMTPNDTIRSQVPPSSAVQQIVVDHLDLKLLELLPEGLRDGFLLPDGHAGKLCGDVDPVPVAGAQDVLAEERLRGAQVVGGRGVEVVHAALDRHRDLPQGGVLVDQA